MTDNRPAPPPPEARRRAALLTALGLAGRVLPERERTDADRYLLRMLAAGAWDWGPSKGWRW